jgi:hypothetical protein
VQATRVVRHCLLVGLAISVIASVSSCSAVRSFPGQLPNVGGFVTDVGSAQAFRDHGMRIPEGAHGLGYEADSRGEGYPLHAYFSIPCSEVPAFVAGSSLSEVGYFWDLPSASVQVFAEEEGWPVSDRSARWYQRPRGPSANLEALVSGAGAACTVYLTASE